MASCRLVFFLLAKALSVYGLYFPIQSEINKYRRLIYTLVNKINLYKIQGTNYMAKQDNQAVKVANYGQLYLDVHFLYGGSP
jgi:hypothetical protein